MIQILKKAIAICSLVVLGGAMLYNCEPDPDALGEQLFLGDAAQGTEKAFEITTFNILNNDQIRSDASKLVEAAPLGAFKEGQFGMQRASYLTQLRLSTYNPDFGTDAVVDSVVLVIKPTFASDSVTTTTLDDNYTYKTTADETVNAKKVVNTYPVTKFGKAKKTLNIHVNEVTTFLKGSSDSVQSNQNFAYDATLLGSKEFKGSISSVLITKDSDGSELFTTASIPGIRIPLDKTFFQNKIIAKKGQPELQDASNFIRHIKGLRISVAEDDGYLFKFSPNAMQLIMYYKNGTGTAKTPATYAFDLGSANTHIGQYEYNRNDSALKSAAIGSESNSVTKLFVQGMGGPSVGVKFPLQTIQDLRKLKTDNKSAIISAKVRLYIDPSWKNSYTKPAAFTLLQRTSNDYNVSFTEDLSAFATLPGFVLIRSNLTNDRPYYDFVVTQSLKTLVEKQEGNEASGKYLKIDIGAFLTDVNKNLIGPKITSRSYDTQRVVLVGADATNTTDNNRAQLLVTYGTK
ncbi:DUF4270 family protein [uncultured Chryseobacterium sp.]|uniref:DUF4270 family protein n=1 Tax=uncultured Chryseobacterium sp. TaxID=259322 RepID=UPI0025F796BA|nr:DUF4270 family protein [uncultured Chryseobacterium sp.]